MKKITPLDAIKAFYFVKELLPNLAKDVNGDIKKLEAGLKKIKKQVEMLSQDELLKYHLDNYHPRYDNYINSEWELKEISLEDCGVWPGMGGLPYEFTKGNVLETSKHVSELLKNRNKITWKTSRVLYIDEIKSVSELITKYVPIIVLEDGVIRNNKLKEDKKISHSKCKYDIDDGNHRAIAYALLGKKTIMALVGKRIYKSNLIYN